MNDATLKELRIVVERAVRPVRASLARKRKMREELLAHLMAIFEEEIPRVGDEQVALDHAKRRFGDPRELSGQIQGVVPRWEWLGGVMDSVFLFRWGESVIAHATRIGISMLAFFAVTLVLVPLALWLRGRSYEIERVEVAFLVATACFGGLFFVVTLLGHGLRRAWFTGAASRSVLRATTYLVLLAMVVPILGFVLAWTAASDLAVGFAHFRSLLWTIPLVPAAILAALWQIERDARIDEGWTSLEIEE